MSTSLGGHWRSTFDRYLKATFRNNEVTTVIVERANGQVLTLTKKDNVWRGDSDVDIRLTQSGNTWRLVDSTDTVETYSIGADGTGILTAIEHRGGYREELSYDNDHHLLAVRDNFGRELTFTYDKNRLHTLTTPDGLVLTYGYTSSGAHGAEIDRLVSVSYSTNPVTHQLYLYENSNLPFALTGIIDENGQLYASWTYDNLGRVLSSQHAGGVDRTTITYNDSDGSRTVTNALGATMVYRFTVLQGILKLTSVDRVATPSIPAAMRKIAYDANGYIASQSDWNGNLITYENDARGRPVRVTEAAGTTRARTTVIDWDSARNLPRKVVTSGLTAEFQYDALGNLLRRTDTDTASGEKHTRTWSYERSDGTLSSIHGPRTDIAQLVRFTYDASGRLTGITNAVGQSIQIASHLPGGLPTSVVDQNGVRRDYQYNSRGWLLSITEATRHSPRTVKFLYDKAGNPVSIRFPDDSLVTFAYDAAHRLTRLENGEGEHADFTLDPLGDITQASVAARGKEAVNLVTREFDKAGRLTRSIQGEGEPETFAYDQVGNILSVRDASGRLIHQQFDELHRLISLEDPGLHPMGETGK